MTEYKDSVVTALPTFGVEVVVNDDPRWNDHRVGHMKWLCEGLAVKRLELRVGGAA